jgi:hypothetical protein
MEQFKKIEAIYRATGGFPSSSSTLGKYLTTLSEQNGVKANNYDVLFKSKDWRYQYSKTQSVRKAGEIKKFKEEVGRFPTKGKLRKDFEAIKKADKNKVKSKKGRRVLEEHFLGF